MFTHLLAITDHYVVNLCSVTKIGETFLNPMLCFDVEKTPFWSSEQARIILDCVTLGWGIYDAEHLFQVGL